MSNLMWVLIVVISPYGGYRNYVPSVAMQAFTDRAACEAGASIVRGANASFAAVTATCTPISSRR